jgi:hypothetical protein
MDSVGAGVDESAREDELRKEDWDVAIVSVGHIL